MCPRLATLVALSAACGCQPRVSPSLSVDHPASAQAPAAAMPMTSNVLASEPSTRPSMTAGGDRAH